MRRVFYWLGVVFAVIIVAGIAGGVFLLVQGNRLDSESRAYVDSSVPAVANGWNQSELVSRASPALLATIKPGDLTVVFGKLAPLGAFVSYNGAKGEANISNWNGVTSITAAYVAKATFQNGNATFNVKLSRHDGKWMIDGFHVNLDNLSPART